MERSRRTLASAIALGALLTALFVAIATPASAATGNLIANGSVATGTVEGTIVPATNVQDVWSVHMWAGDTVLLDVDSSAARLQVYSTDSYPTATDVVGTLLATRIPGITSPLSFTADTTGYYKVRVTSTDAVNSTAYEVSATIVNFATYMAIDAPISVSTTYGARPSFSGYVYNPRALYTVMPHGTLSVSWSTDGRVFWPFSTAALHAGDRFAFSPASGTFQKTWWNVVFVGDDGFGPSSGTFVVTPFADVSAPTATRTKARTYVVRNTMRPTQVAGSAPERVYIERKVTGRWKAYGYLKPKAADGPYGAYSICSVTKTFPNAGAWRVRAYFPGTAVVLPTWTPWVALTVK